MMSWFLGLDDGGGEAFSILTPVFGFEFKLVVIIFVPVVKRGGDCWIRGAGFGW